jgi:hypothetical protein
VKVTVDYSSPDVHGPGGEDRAGKIWGELVPYGLHDLGFNDCKQCPWRGGANENTVLTVSHDVTVEDQPPKAARFCLDHRTHLGDGLKFAETAVGLRERGQPGEGGDLREEGAPAGPGRAESEEHREPDPAVERAGGEVTRE